MLDLALSIAEKLQYKYKICAIITDKKDNVLGIGTNSYTKSHPMQGYYAKKAGFFNRIYLHAELAAIIKARSGSPYRIYIARATKEGSGTAKPCPVCSLALKEFGIKEIIYTT